MCRSMVDIQSPTAEIRRAKRKERNRMKIYMVSLFHRATINHLVVIKHRLQDSTTSLADGLLVTFSSPSVQLPKLKV